MTKTANVSTRLANFFSFSDHTSLHCLTVQESSRKQGRGRKSRALHLIQSFSWECLMGVSGTALDDGWRHPAAAHEQREDTIWSQGATSWGWREGAHCSNPRIGTATNWQWLRKTVGSSSFYPVFIQKMLICLTGHFLVGSSTYRGVRENPQGPVN